MAMWNRCAICGRAIPVGELCYEIKNWHGEPIDGDTICSDCLAPENALTLTPQNEWVSVEERLPEQDGSYRVVTERGAITTARFYTARKFRDGYHLKCKWQTNRSVTHWMPMPAPHGRRTLEGENA